MTYRVLHPASIEPNAKIMQNFNIKIQFSPLKKKIQQSTNIWKSCLSGTPARPCQILQSPCHLSPEYLVNSFHTRRFLNRYIFVPPFCTTNVLSSTHTDSSGEGGTDDATEHSAPWRPAWRPLGARAQLRRRDAVRGSDVAGRRRLRGAVGEGGEAGPSPRAVRRRLQTAGAAWRRAQRPGGRRAPAAAGVALTLDRRSCVAVKRGGQRGIKKYQPKLQHCGK